MPSLLKADYKKGIVYLYQFPRSPVIASLSPYCLKLETWLRMAAIDYENIDCSALTTRSSKGLMPFIELDGKQYADSAFIIKDLTKIFDKTEMESSLSNEQKACARAFVQMIENSTVASYTYFRWVENTDVFLSESIVGPSSILVKLPFIKWSLRKTIKKRLHSHGIGRHNREEILSIGLDDLRALSTYMGNKKFFGGDTPSSVDASLFGFLAQIVYIPVETPFGNFVKADCLNLVQYCDRIKNTFWPDWDEACAKRSLHTTWKKE